MQAAKKMEVFDTYENYRYHETLQRKAEENERNTDRKFRDCEAKKVTRFLKTLLFCSFIFVSFAMMIYQYASLYEEQYVVNGLKSDIKQMGMDIEEVKSTLDSTVSLDNVERVAMTELNMQYPQPEQIVYIKSNWHYALDKPVQNKYLGKEEKIKNEKLSENVYNYILKYAFGDKTNSTTIK